MAPPSVIRLHPDDGVVIARATLLPGTPVAAGVAAAERIPAGHKVAVRSIAAGEAVRRYGQIIGFASCAIAPGQHVHVQNCEMGDFAKDYAFGVDAKPTDYANTPATFDGIRRPDGRVATRNYIGILTSVNCSAHVAGLIADVFRRNPFTGDDPLAEFPNVDGVVALTHKTGCGMTESEPLRVLRRTLAGYARHANFSHVVVLGLGCEVNQIRGLMQEQRLTDRIRNMDIQSMGGTRKTVEAGVAIRQGGSGRSEPGAPRTGAGERADGGAAMRRFGWILRRVSQSRARCGERSAGAARRLGDPVGDAGDLRRGTSADAPRGVA